MTSPRSHDVVEQVEAARERLAEPLLLAFDHRAHEVVLRDQLGIRVAHHRDRRVDQRRRDELLRAEEVRVSAPRAG